MRHGKGCDCDDCFAYREHSEHVHCLGCGTCLGNENTSTSDEDRCKKCVPCKLECGCDSEYAHELAEDESRREFLRAPGAPPAHWDDETRARVSAAVERDRAKLRG